ncbi:PREDICTED: MAP3K12-binding inhibitory protein 1-like [Acropora digitifera]|uniref:MAP3K12-binding inhibitory protein 1-like n=1 Tax=Acropora digitifera TaxID=70779 RepID=UPI00077B1657|nr:PREDICTED: MAP3K12-binding inhibitory protein 1-like [Acropora digitifera]
MPHWLSSTSHPACLHRNIVQHVVIVQYTHCRIISSPFFSHNTWLCGPCIDFTVNYNAVDVDTSLVQVKAGKEEIDRRISAFIQRKRVEVDLLNKREFCNVVNTGTNNEFQCARTDAVFVHRIGQKGHIKATRVENTNTTSEAQALGPEISNTSTIPLEAKDCPGIEERLRNLETHFGYKPGRPLPCDVYKRLTNLEEKVLFLEGMSPEYFSQNTQNSGHGSHHRRKENDSSQGLTLHSIDERIRSLRSSLSKGQAS